MVKITENKRLDYILDAFGKKLNGVKNPKQDNKWYVRRVW